MPEAAQVVEPQRKRISVWVPNWIHSRLEERLQARRRTPTGRHHTLSDVVSSALKFHEHRCPMNTPPRSVMPEKPSGPPTGPAPAPPPNEVYRCDQPPKRGNGQPETPTFASLMEEACRAAGHPFTPQAELKRVRDHLLQIRLQAAQILPAYERALATSFSARPDAIRTSSWKLGADLANIALRQIEASSHIAEALGMADEVGIAREPQEAGR